MKRRVNQTIKRALAVALTAGFFTVSPSLAQFNQGNSVTFQGEPMFAISGSAGGMTSFHRAWVAQDNFDNALVRSSDKSPDAVAVARRNNAFTVTLGGHYITTADFNSARDAGLTPEELANKWADAIKAKLSDHDATQNYVARLCKDHTLEGGVALVDKDVMVTDIDKIPFNLAEGTLAVNPEDTDMVMAILDQNVVLPNCKLPEGTVLSGTVLSDRQGNKFVRFDKANFPDGTSAKLKGVVASKTFQTEAPRPVISSRIPVDPATESRDAAMLGIGAQKGSVAVLQARPNVVAVRAEQPNL